MTLRRAVFATIALLLGSASAFAQEQIHFIEYSAKYLCGEAKEGASVRPGTYETSINIHNPDFFQRVYFAKKAVRAPRQGDPQPRKLPPFEGGFLDADFAERIDCKKIRDLLGQAGNDPFIEGFVVLVVIPIPWNTPPRELDVVGVYTVDTPPRSISLEMLPIAPRLQHVPGAAGHNLRDQLLRRLKPESRPE